MAYDFRDLKKQKKPEFHKNFGKYYPVKSLGELGFGRSVCKKCGRGFWSLNKRDFCDEPACSGGYRFIGEKLTRKKFGYREAWDEYVGVFSKWGYVPIKRYPVVCRWYDQLYFVNAGINDFQPYVVSGEVKPPADAVLEPQFCLRFSDLDSVGITGRHYTGFIMVGQHTFNTPEKHVYFKDEGILQIHEFLTKGLGIPASEIFYHEDVWAGGGNFGPSMEFFARGLELGNQVYMQYEVLPDGSSRELKTKVIDMGAGLERWSWFSQGTPMSYDTVFPKVLAYLYKSTNIKPNDKLWNNFARYSGLLSFDEIEDSGAVWKKVAKDVGVNLEELKREVYRMRALYAIGDHTRALLVAIHDGALPSNVGGGYNLRNILRRCWDLMDEFALDIELEKVFEKHIQEFGSWYTELKETGSLWDILGVERKRYEDGKKKWPMILHSERLKITPEKLVELYLSHGIPPSFIEKNIKGFKIPDDFYLLVEEHRQLSKAGEEKKEIVLPAGLPETQSLYYDNPDKTDFTARVVSVFKDYVILDRTFFYPEGGGQESDRGKLNGVDVLDVQKVSNVVLHKVKDATKFKPGDVVNCTLDVERRKQLIQHHTATHIINAAAYKVLGPHIWQAGAHKSADSARLDVTHYQAISDDELRKIEKEANRIVNANIAVKKHLLSRDEAEKKYGFRIYQGGAVPGTELRIVEILGVDAEACGGLHLDNTKDAGTIKVVRATRIQDGVVRIEFKAGRAAEEQEAEAGKILNGVGQAFDKLLIAKKFPHTQEELNLSAQAFSVPPENLLQTVNRFMNELKERNEKLAAIGESPVEIKPKKTIHELCAELFSAWKESGKKLEKLTLGSTENLEKELSEKFKQTRGVKHIIRGVNVRILRELANKLMKEPDRLLVIANIDGDKANLVVASSKHAVNAAEIAKRISAKIGGGASGNNFLAMGGGSSKNIEKILEELKV